MKNNNYIRHMPYLRNSIAYDHGFWYTCVKWWYLQVFFLLIFSFFWLLGQKIAQDDKKICLFYWISQEPYIIWLSFMVHKCKMIISPGFFLFFSKFWIFGFLGGSNGKKWPKMTKKLVSLRISGTVPHMIMVFGTHV